MDMLESIVTITPEKRPLLNLFPHARGKRSHITCELKCANECDEPIANTSDNSYFRDVASSNFSRRNMLTGMAAASAGLVLATAAGTSPAEALADAVEEGKKKPGLKPGFKPNRLEFAPIDPVEATVDAVSVPEGYDWNAIIRWGDPLFADSPKFDVNNQTAEAQAMQFGYNCDYLDILICNSASTKGLLICNHEYTNEKIMFAPDFDSEEAKKIAIASHGMTVVELERDKKGQPWKYIQGAPKNRRITPATEFKFTGPAAGSDLLKTKAEPTGRTVLGTLNNCAGSTTPWGTILSGEENFNQYFVANESEEVERYGIPTKEKGRKWWTVDPRFDARIEGNENEINRFGWVVEVDPSDPESTPLKHTAMGRFKHEAAAVQLTRDGRAAAYSGDDGRFEYVYKFVSRKHMRHGKSAAAKKHNMALLSDGDLYVAKFVGDSPADQITGDGELPKDCRFDGRGYWLPLVVGRRSMVSGMSVDEVLVNTRLAADKMGATKMDRPEDVQPNPHDGRVYIACTNNTKRAKDDYPGVDEANPRRINREGHVVEIIEDRNDASSMGFRWNLLLVCGEPDTAGTYFGGWEGEVSPISCPDNVAFDSVGTLWVSTDGQPKTLKLNDALHKVPTRGKNRGQVQQFLAVPREAETCGPVIHDREDTVYVAVQHPGERGKWGEQTSYFPDYTTPNEMNDDKWGGPRPSVIQVGRFEGRNAKKD